MVKNYLVCAVRPVTDNWMHRQDNTLYDCYNEMFKIRSASFKKFVQEPYEEIVWTEAVADNEQYTKQNWKQTQALKALGPCNIFWAGADTLMTKPTSLFGDRFREFRLFNYTEPRTHHQFPDYFNDDVLYYPHTMDEFVWNLGEFYWQGIEDHPDRKWGFDQLRHNAMFWSQNIERVDRFHPEMAYQAMNLRTLDASAVAWHDQWNGIKINDAHILHFHGSRNCHQALAVMRQICNQLGVSP